MACMLPRELIGEEVAAPHWFETVLGPEPKIDVKYCKEPMRWCIQERALYKLIITTSILRRPCINPRYIA